MKRIVPILEIILLLSITGCYTKFGTLYKGSQKIKPSQTDYYQYNPSDNSPSTDNQNTNIDTEEYSDDSYYTVNAAPQSSYLYSRQNVFRTDGYYSATPLYYNNYYSNPYVYYPYQWNLSGGYVGMNPNPYYYNSYHYNSWYNNYWGGYSYPVRYTPVYVSPVTNSGSANISGSSSGVSTGGNRIYINNAGYNRSTRNETEAVFTTPNRLNNNSSTPTSNPSPSSSQSQRSYYLTPTSSSQGRSGNSYSTPSSSGARSMGRGR